MDTPPLQETVHLSEKFCLPFKKVTTWVEDIFFPGMWFSFQNGAIHKGNKSLRNSFFLLDYSPLRPEAITPRWQCSPLVKVDNFYDSLRKHAYSNI